MSVLSFICNELLEYYYDILTPRVSRPSWRCECVRVFVVLLYVLFAFTYVALCGVYVCPRHSRICNNSAPWNVTPFRAWMITGRRKKAPLGQKTTHLVFSATYRYLFTYSFFIAREPIFLSPFETCACATY